MYKRIILFCPSDNLSGGPECIYQLAECLKKIKKNVFIYFYGSNPKEESLKRFQYYDFSVINYFEDSKENFLIFPESYTKLIYKYPKSIKCIYWMSIDNFFRYKNESYIFKTIKKYFSLFKTRARLKDIKDLIHITQSEYAKNYLKSIGIKSKFIGDYLPDVFFENINLNKCKEDIVVYNPKKGAKDLSKLIKISPEINFVPIQNMTQKEVKILLSRSKIYIDFGHHPGKDRIPREAVMCGCCLITNKKGSALNDIDIPIEKRFKIDKLNQKKLKEVKSLINDCFRNYEKNFYCFSNYKEIIKNQKLEFFENTQEFIKLL